MSAYRWIERTRRLKVELFALYLAARHPQTPWYAKLVVAGRAQERIAVQGRSWILITTVWLALVAAGIALTL